MCVAAGDASVTGARASYSVDDSSVIAGCRSFGAGVSAFTVARSDPSVNASVSAYNATCTTVAAWIVTATHRSATARDLVSPVTRKSWTARAPVSSVTRCSVTARGAAIAVGDRAVAVGDTAVAADVAVGGASRSNAVAHSATSSRSSTAVRAPAHHARVTLGASVASRAPAGVRGASRHRRWLSCARSSPE